MNNISSWKLQALQLAGQETSWRKISEILGVPKSTVSDFLRSQLKLGGLPVVEGPKVLFLDIETTPSLAYAWGRFKQYLSQDQIVHEGNVLCFAAKFKGEDRTYFSGFTNNYQDDTLIVCKAHALLDEADIVIAHNAKGFDIPYLNARFVQLGLRPPSAYKIIDTLEVAKRYFKFPSNKLDSLGEYLQLGRKTSHEGFSLWVSCMQQEIEALEKMRDYNINDVDLLEKVYETLKAWDMKSPNAAQYYEDDKVRCRVCGSEHVEDTGEKVYTDVYAYKQLRCTDCGSLQRSAQNIMPKSKSKSLLRAIR